MASSPALKIFTPEGEYIASAKEVAAAAAVVSVYGDGSTIRLGHSKRSILWTQGKDGDAAESFDTCGAVMAARAGDHWSHLIIY